MRQPSEHCIVVDFLIWVLVQVMPFLSPFIGPGRLFNFLIRNRWRNDEAIAKLGQLPVLLISSIEVHPMCYFASARSHPILAWTVLS